MGSVRVGTTSQLSLTITNNGGAALTVDNLLLAKPEDDQTIEIATVPDKTIAPGGSTKLTLKVTPKTSSAKSANVSLSTNDSDSKVVTIPFTYTATEPDVSVFSEGVEYRHNLRSMSSTSEDYPLAKSSREPSA